MSSNLPIAARAVAAEIGKRAKLKKGRAAQREYELARQLRQYARSLKPEEAGNEGSSK